MIYLFALGIIALAVWSPGFRKVALWIAAAGGAVLALVMIAHGTT